MDQTALNSLEIFKSDQAVELFLPHCEFDRKTFSKSISSLRLMVRTKVRSDIPRCFQSSRLRELDLTHCGLLAEDLVVLSFYVIRSSAPNLQKLNLANNNIGKDFKKTGLKG